MKPINIKCLATEDKGENKKNYVIDLFIPTSCDLLLTYFYNIFCNLYIYIHTHARAHTYIYDLQALVPITPGDRSCSMMAFCGLMC